MGTGVPGLEVRRLGEQAVYVVAVFALELDVFGGHEVQLGHERIVVGGELAQGAVFEGVDFGGIAVVGDRARRCGRRPHPRP